MSEGRNISTPATSETSTGSATETHGANTNLDASMQGGPATAADQASVQEVQRQNAESGVPGPVNSESEES